MWKLVDSSNGNRVLQDALGDTVFASEENAAAVAAEYNWLLRSMGCVKVARYSSAAAESRNP